MPLYDLYCDCGFTTEKLLKLNNALPNCPKCNKILKKKISPVSFVLKGDCWAKDNYSSEGAKND